MLRLHPDRPLNPLLLELMRALDRATTALGITYFLIGATARDILLEHVYELETSRATRDIDFAVAVSSWDEFDRLKTQLTVAGAFMSTANAHRLTFGAGAGAYPMDLVPFDGVERSGEIAWPPLGEFIMNVTGYSDALKSALKVEIEPGFEVKIVSLPAMVALKILAWDERRERAKDASDVYLLLRNYAEAGQFERLYADGLDLLELWGYDLALAGSALLGRDAQRDLAAETIGQVCAVLADENKQRRFLAQMVQTDSGSDVRAAQFLDAFSQALMR